MGFVKMCELIERLQSKLTDATKPQEPAKPKRRRAEEDGQYYYIDNDGLIENTIDEGYDIEDRRYSSGNYFHTEEEAKASTLYHILNSDYFYWVPDCPRPEELPEGCEYINSFGEWEKSYDGPKKWVRCRRWPKNMENKN
jgi:hypothetical protein